MSIFYISSTNRANNDSGVVLRAATAGTVLNNVAIPLDPDSLPFASTVAQTSNVQGLLAGGEFAYDNNKPLIKGYTNSINNFSPAEGINSTGNANSENTSAIHPVSFVRTRLVRTAFRDGRFNNFTGKFDAGYPDVQLDDLLVDVAANPSRAEPGRIHFTYGKRLISSGYYPKTG
jgi:hypothetical protein